MSKRIYTVISVLVLLVFMLGGCDFNDTPITYVSETVSEQTTMSEEAVESETLSEPFIPTETKETSQTAETSATEETTSITETTATETTALPVTEPAVPFTETTTAATTAPLTEKTTTAISLAPQTGNKPLQKEIIRSYAYNTLTEKEKRVYDIFEGAAVSFSNRADFEGLSVTKAELERAVYAFDLYEPLYSYISLGDCVIHSKGGIVEYVELAYFYDKTTHQKMTASTVVAADKIIAKITPDMTEYDAVKLIHDEIAKKCVYDESAQNKNFAYGVLVEGRATCVGYAKAFNYLCNRAGIENTCVFGIADEQGHMWNMVKLDGEWYEIDVTWDDTSADEFENFIYYDFFLVTTERMSNRQLYDYNYSKPVANGTKYNYYRMTNTYAEDDKTLEESVYNCLKSAALNNEKYAQFKYKDANIFALFKEYAQNGRMYDIITRVENDTGCTFDKARMNYYKSEKDTIIILSL